MQPTNIIWMNGEFIPWFDAKVHVMTHALHYGSGVFEGIRVYKTARGPAIFRLREHMERLIYSAQMLDLNVQYSVDQLCDITCEVVRRNKLEHGYIRPLAFYGYGVMGLNPRNSPTEIMISCWPWGSYLPVEQADIKVSKYIRIHPRSTVPDAKICGHYVNSILAVLEIKGTRYHEALFLDSDGVITEGPGENFFIVRSNQLLTPPRGGILPGITRATIIEIAHVMGITVCELPITLDEALAADEAFFTGTAAEVTPIATINDTRIGASGVGPITQKLKDAYDSVVHGREEHHLHFLTFLQSD